MPESRPVRRWKGVAVILLAAATLFVSLGQGQPAVNAEQRCEDVVRAVVSSGRWVEPCLNDRPKVVNKPPLFYWASALACKAAGGFSLLPFRLPSAVAGVALLLLVLAWGRELGAPREALLAVALLACTYEFLIQGRIGSYEMLLAFFCGASLYCAARAERTPSWGWAIGAAVSFGLGFLTKGPPALLFTLVTLAAWAIARRQFRVFANPRVWGVLLLALLLGLSWHLYEVIFYPACREILLDQALLPFGRQPHFAHTAPHREPFWWYFKELPRKGFLLALFVPAFIAQACKVRSEGWDSPWRLLLLSFVVPFAVLSFLPGKQDHYLLSALPPLALLTARGMLWAVEQSLWRWVVVVPAFFCLLVTLLAAAVAGWLLVVLDRCGILAACVAGGLIAAVAVWGVVLLMQFRFRRAALATFLAASLIWLAYFAEIKPLVDSFGAVKRSGEAAYDEAYWKTKFERHPLLGRFMHFHKRAAHESQDEDEH